MPMVTKLFRMVTCCEVILPINTHDISTEWSCWVAWQIKYHLRKMYWDQDRQGADLVVEAPKHDHLINWPTWGHVTVWEICISIFMTFIANKLGRLLTLGRIFSMQTHHRLLVLVFFSLLIFIFARAFYFILQFNFANANIGKKVSI